MTSSDGDEIPFSSLSRRVWRQTSVLKEDKLKAEEAAFLEAVGDGKAQAVRDLIRSYPDLDVNCFDIHGLRALEISVENLDVETTEELLQQSNIDVDHLYSAMLTAIFNNEIDLLELMLESPVMKKAAMERGDCFPNIPVNNVTPLMAASMLNNFEITTLLLDNSHFIQVPHHPNCMCKEKCYLEEEDELYRSQIRLNTYRALSSPTYIILTAEDPILKAFQLCRELRKIATSTPEFQNDYSSLAMQCEEFAIALLDECKNKNEIQAVLSQKRGLPTSRCYKFPRLYLAVLLEQKKFVAHPSCQQVLRSLWTEGLPLWVSWPERRHILHFVHQSFLAPVYCFLYLLIPKNSIAYSFQVPLNRYIYHVTSYIFFLVCLTVSLLIRQPVQSKITVTWPEVMIGIWIVGYTWNLLMNVCRLGIGMFLRSSWSVYDVIMFFLFLMAGFLWIGSFFTSATKENPDRQSWEWYHPYLLGEGIYAIASVLAFCRLLFVLQMHPSIGPLCISLKYMAADVMRFLFILLIVYFAFGAGINSIYKNYDRFFLIDSGGQAPPYFSSLLKTLKALFWALFAMNDSNYADMIVAANNQTIRHYFSEMVGYCLWAGYHVVTVIVLLNILIAMMAESYERVQRNAYLEWIFSRSSHWLAFFDMHSSIPPPFNLLPTIHCFRSAIVFLKRSIRRKTVPELSGFRNECCFEDEIHKSSERSHMNYKKLMSTLVRRYLQRQKHRLKTTDSDVYGNGMCGGSYDAIPPRNKSVQFYRRRRSSLLAQSRC